MPPAASVLSAADDDDLPPVAGGGSERLQRWVDLLAALLIRNASASFVELAADVPGYQAHLAESLAAEGKAAKTLGESLKRAFERDKDELRRLGVPIESTMDGQGNAGALYRLKRNDFYLPYLCLAVPGGARRSPPHVDEYGYKTLSSLDIEPDELAAIVDAAASVRALGDPLLRIEIDSAMRKLAVDLPLEDAAQSPDVPRVIGARVQPDGKVFAELSEALRYRKVVAFAYRAMSSDVTEERRVEPYGLFFTNAHWYLAGRDQVRGELRNFRLARISKVAITGGKLQTPDYVVPATFRLREHSQSRHVWELGDADATPVLVEFSGQSGAALAAANLGAAVDGAPMQRRFTVRRMDSFARWILSFGAEVRVLEPKALVAQVRAMAIGTRALYAADPATPLPPPGKRVAAATNTRKPWEPKGAAVQLKRILLVVPQIADGEDHDLADVAAKIGTDVRTLQLDLNSLVDRYDTPGGFIEGVRIYIEVSTVSAQSRHLRRPMRLTVPELCALELGLAVLRTQRPLDEHPLIDRARKRLRDVMAKLPNDPIPDSLHNVSLGEYGSVAHMVAVRAALRERRQLRIGYRKSASSVTEERLVCPYAMVASSGMMYLVAHCESRGGLRVFRMDRVQWAEPTDVPFTPPDDFSVDDVLRDGKVFHGGDAGSLRVRYSARIARWIAEREGRAPDADRSLVVEHPLADHDWGCRHVLQYAADAEALHPVELRAKLRSQLDRVVQQYPA